MEINSIKNPQISDKNNEVIIFNRHDKTSPGYFTKIKNNLDLTTYFQVVINSYKKIAVDNSVLLRIHNAISNKQSYYAMDLLKVMNAIKLQYYNKTKDDQFEPLYQKINQSLNFERSMILKADYTFKLKRTVLEKIVEVSKLREDSTEKTYLNHVLHISKEDKEVVVNLKDLAFIIDNISDEQKPMVKRKVELAVQQFHSLNSQENSKQKRLRNNHLVSLSEKNESSHFDRVSLKSDESVRENKRQKISNSIISIDLENEDLKENKEKKIDENFLIGIGLSSSFAQVLLKQNDLDKIISKNREVNEIHSQSLNRMDKSFNLESKELEEDIPLQNSPVGSFLEQLEEELDISTDDNLQSSNSDQEVKEISLSGNFEASLSIEFEDNSGGAEADFISDEEFHEVTSNQEVPFKGKKNKSSGVAPGGEYVVIDRYNIDLPFSFKVVRSCSKEAFGIVLKECKNIPESIQSRLAEQQKKSTPISYNAGDVFVVLNIYLSNLQNAEFGSLFLGKIKFLYEQSRLALLEEMENTSGSQHIIKIERMTLKNMKKSSKILDENVKEYFQKILKQKEKQVIIDMDKFESLFKTIEKNGQYEFWRFYQVAQNFSLMKEQGKEKADGKTFYNSYFSKECLSIKFENKFPNLTIIKSRYSKTESNELNALDQPIISTKPKKGKRDQTLIIDRFNSSPCSFKSLEFLEKKHIQFILDNCKKISSEMKNRIQIDIDKNTKKFYMNASDVWILCNEYLFDNSKYLSQHYNEIDSFDNLKIYYEKSRKSLLEEIKPVSVEARYIFKIHFKILKFFLEAISNLEESDSIKYFRQKIEDKENTRKAHSSLEHETLIINMDHLAALFKDQKWEGYKTSPWTGLKTSQFRVVQRAVKSFSEVKKIAMDKMHEEYFSLEALNTDFGTKFESLKIRQ